MNVFIISEFNEVFYDDINLVRLFFNKNSFSVMNNHVPTIGRMSLISFKKKDKIYLYCLKNAHFIQKKKNLNIICDNYELL
ncbi:hypothetical protein [Candidatus Carsonella ruddii]|uniref:Uncharacterized protein n=1 Tax=Carsonella ruddii TaxID=114186 RepID=A0AAE7KLW2_CARRU|nr:hypothetical protein [Candidatus Carsonella ruddii]AGS06500.1 hypothetical protein CRDC_00055 [Candidatus Carsonella ruddii DC]ALA96767.1 hypothetical protein AMC76_00055 [Candidatus Carsonella ruddii]QLK13983.1 hypothetical protein FK493_00050 [Candidatus Carsonella ruddii]